MLSSSFFSSLAALSSSLCSHLLCLLCSRFVLLLLYHDTSLLCLAVCLSLYFTSRCLCLLFTGSFLSGTYTDETIESEMKKPFDVVTGVDALIGAGKSRTKHL